MGLSRHGAALLAFLAARYGGRVGETEIRAALGISHGTFVRARRELVEGGFLFCEAGSGNQPPVYRAGRMAGADAPLRRAAVRPGGDMLTEAAGMERVAGDFASVDDWVDALTAALGDVDVSECLDGSYAVYSHRFGQTAVYAASFGVYGVTFS